MTTHNPFKGMQIVDIKCPICGEVQRRVVLDERGTSCTKCKARLKYGDGIVRPGLAKCGTHEGDAS